MYLPGGDKPPGLPGLVFLQVHVPRSQFNTTLTAAVLALACALFWCPGPAAQAAWPHTHTDGMFVFHADFPLTTSQPLLQELVLLKGQIEQSLRLQCSSERIDVYLFQNRSVYEQYMRRYFPHVHPRRAMFIKSNSPGNVFAYASQDFGVDLRHECTHALLHTALPVVPLWLDEGLAEYFEVSAADRVFGHSALAATRRRVRWQRPPSIQRLEQISTLSEMGPGEYRNAWAWVHFMLHGPPEAREELWDYLHEISRHVPPRPLSERLSKQIPDLDRAFAAHFARWHP